MRIVIGGRVHPHVNGHAKLMQAGLARHGLKVDIMPVVSIPTADVVICWGWRNAQRFRERGIDVLVMERGYIGDRHKWTSLAWNGLNGYGEFCLPDTTDDERFDRNFGGLMRPWKTGGDYVLLLGQVPGDASLQGRDMGPWYRAAAERAQRAYNLPVRFRPHPEAQRRGLHVESGLRPLRGDLQAALSRASVAVTWNSNSAVDAVLAGVPVVVCDRGAMAWEVAGHEIGDDYRPERGAWAKRLAHCQWSEDEIASGEAWDRMKVYLDRRGLWRAA